MLGWLSWHEWDKHIRERSTEKTHSKENSSTYWQCRDSWVVRVQDRWLSQNLVPLLTSLTATAALRVNENFCWISDMAEQEGCVKQLPHLAYVVRLVLVTRWGSTGTKRMPVRRPRPDCAVSYLSRTWEQVARSTLGHSRLVSVCISTRSARGHLLNSLILLGGN